jgi:hypothetical protein
MRGRIARLALVSLLSALALSGLVRAWAPVQPPTLDWWVMDAGGQALYDGQRLEGSLGETFIGSADGAGAHLEAGFWSVIAAWDAPAPTPTPGALKLYLPVILQ